ncbi:hypothetical protein RJ639_045017 [Escallonia herrerae]|uniref:Bet v I/Major latex protein domain-containing protein n=1 Tax=Escallonia herrerae TaxID=1293975 RepID=A0AA88WAK0_9ASTE|nr:hypothetical protein RJ639_045017 [Escallonia herrerae]
MNGTLSYQTAVNVPASEAWLIYGTLQLAYICVPELFESIKPLKGNGEAGTIIQITTIPGICLSSPRELDFVTKYVRSLFYMYEDKLAMVDNKTMMKQVEAHKGGYLSLGFNMFGVRFEVIKKNETSCITKVTIIYDLKEGYIANTVHVSIEPFIALVKYSNNYLVNNHKK